jgi:hypothetical protein
MGKRKLTEEDKRIRALRGKNPDLSWYKHWLKHIPHCICTNGAVPTYAKRRRNE